MELKDKIIKGITSLAGAVLFLLLLLNIMFFFRQPDLIFFPVKEHHGTPSDWDLPYKDVYIESGKETLHGWFVQNKSPMVVLFFHGNGGNISHRGDTLQILHALGYSTLIIDYQGYGKSTGVADEQGLYRNARSAWDYLEKQKKYLPEQIILFGRSLGGAVAARLATEVKPAGLVLESTFTSINDMARVVAPDLYPLIYLRYRFDTLGKLKKITCPVLVIHSQQDEMIPFEFGMSIYQSLQTEKAFLRIHGSHNSGFADSLKIYLPALKQFFNQLNPAREQD